MSSTQLSSKLLMLKNQPFKMMQLSVRNGLRSIKEHSSTQCLVGSSTHQLLIALPIHFYLDSPITKLITGEMLRRLEIEHSLLFCKPESTCSLHILLVPLMPTSTPISERILQLVVMSDYGHMFGSDTVSLRRKPMVT